MNKDDLQEEVKRLTDIITKLKSNNSYLLEQQKVFKKMAEKSGSEMAVWRHKCLRLEEELNKMKAV